MSDKGDKSLEDLESSRCNYAKGGLMFCMSPPPRNKTGRKKKSESPGDVSNDRLKGPVKDKIIREKDACAKKQDSKPDHPTEGRTKGEAFCISPPVPKKTRVNKGLIQDVQRPQIVEKLRNGRINALQSSRRQPLKADHSIRNKISSSIVASHTNEKVTKEPGYKSDGHTNGTEPTNPENKPEGQTNDTQTPNTQDQSTGAVHEPHSDCYTDGTDRKTTHGDDEKSKNPDEKGLDSTATEAQNEKEKQRKESRARFLQAWAELFAQNRSEIQKLREQISTAKEDISKICEEEENWKCRVEMQKCVINANIEKIEHRKKEQPFWYSGVYGAEPTLEQLKSNLTESRVDLIYQLSRIQKVTQESAKEKVMERRRLGERYPKWVLPNFRKAYSKYSEKHLVNESLIKTKCPKLDIIVPIQKRPDNSRQFYKVLIDGRYFNYKKTGLTQVMGQINEEVDKNGKLELNASIKITSNENLRNEKFRKPHNTNAIDVNFIRKNGCDASIMSLVDAKRSDTPKMSPTKYTSAADSITDVKKENETLTNKSASVHTPHPPSSPIVTQTEATASRRNNKTITQKVKEDITTANEAKSKLHSASGAREDGASYTSPLSAPYKPPTSVGYVLLFDESKPPQQQMHLEQLCDHKPPECEEYSGYGDGESKDIVQPIEINRSKANSPNRDKQHKINQMESGGDEKVNDTRRKGLSRSAGKEKQGETAGSDSWQHGHSVLPPIGESLEYQTSEGEEITKCELNTTLGNKRASIQCDSDMIPVKVPHRTPLSNVVTYVMALVRKDTIIPLSLARQGSLIPIRNKRFSLPKQDSQRKLGRRGRADGRNVKGAQKRGVSRSQSKKKLNDANGSRSWQQRHQILPPIGQSARRQRKKKKITKRVANVKLGDQMLSIVCDSNIVPVKVLHRAPLSTNVTLVVTLVEKSSITPFPLKRQGSFIPIRPQYAKQDIREHRKRERNRPCMQNLQNRRYLYTIQERSQEFDDGFYGSPTNHVSLPFASYQDDQPNSPLGSYPQDEITTYSAAMEYEILYTPDSPYRQDDSSPEIHRDASVVSLGFTPGGNVDDVAEVRTEELPKEDEKTSGKGDERLQEDDEELITDWSAFYSPRNSNVNCCGYRGTSVSACACSSTCSKVRVPHPPSTKRPATATCRRRSFVRKVGALL